MGFQREQALTRRLPVFLAWVCAVAHIGCGAAPPGTPPSPDSPIPAVAAPARVIPELRLERLVAERPPPRESRRNPFQFGAAPQARPEPPVGESPLPSSEPAATATPDAPDAASAPGTAGISLRLIGIVEVGAAAGRVAVLASDGGVHHGRVGDTTEGRYRIVSTGETSVELEDLTSGARTTLRLSGF